MIAGHVGLWTDSSDGISYLRSKDKPGGHFLPVDGRHPVDFMQMCHLVHVRAGGQSGIHIITKWLVSGVGVDFGGITRPRPAFRLGKPFCRLGISQKIKVACAHCMSCRALALDFMWQIYYYMSPAGILVVAKKDDESNSYPTCKPGGFVQLTRLLNHTVFQYLKLKFEHIPSQKGFEYSSRGSARNHYFSSATKWLAQAILSDAIKMGLYLIYLILLLRAKWLAQAILPDAIKTGVDTACDEKSTCFSHILMSRRRVDRSRTCQLASQATLSDAIKRAWAWFAQTKYALKTLFALSELSHCIE
ncbi:hypothetical protein DFH09DRAFT_1095227 [Mycena vulgaris]|nr:hypothetical protein DFH09DRAFT_1095227 [Mycena vulgaris]